MFVALRAAGADCEPPYGCHLKVLATDQLCLETRFHRFSFCTTSLLPENTPTRARSRARILPPGRQVVFPRLS